MTNIERILKERRMELGYSKKTLGAMTSISQVSLTKYEKGISIPSSVSLFRICQALELDCDQTYEMAEQDKKNLKKGGN